MCFFAAAIIISAVCIRFVKINYDDTKYLPDSSNQSWLLVMESNSAAAEQRRQYWTRPTYQRFLG